MATLIEPKSIDGLIGWRQAYVATTGSTNADLFAYAKSGSDAERLWLVAGEQLEGRGRRGRVWVSPQGNLHASLYLENPAPKSEIGFLPLVCAVAVHRAITAALGQSDCVIKIKWPNDILIDGAKCCGMLLESEMANGHINIVVGCGMNIVAHPEDTPYPAMHLKQVVPSLTSNDMFQYLAQAFAETFQEWENGTNQSTIRDYWLQHARGLGETITVNLANSSIEGICEGIDANGFLLLREPSGKKHEISAGDVFFPHITK